MDITIALAIFVGLALGVIAGYLLRGNPSGRKLQEADKAAERVLKAAERDAAARRREADLEVKDQIFRAKAELEQETKSQRVEMANLEKHLIQKETHLDKREELLNQREAENSKREKKVEALEQDVRQQATLYERQVQEHRMKLEGLAGMTADEAKRQLMATMEEDARHDMAGLLKRMEDETRETAERKAQQILSLTIERMAAEQAAEISVSVVNLPSDEMKGRIIGREGRNIRALESITGVDLIIDDTPEAVLLSCFDPVRREVARIALERLVSDGRIHPARIEEVVEKVREDVEATLREEGEKAAFDLGIHNLHPEILKLMGRLKYRTSFGQNVLEHSKEVGFFCGIMAGELRGDVKLARRVGLLHDLGKAVSHEVEGGHDQIGAELVKKYGESARVANCIGAHHEGEEARCLEAVLVSAADAISAARPGVRRETLETYIKRLEKLEAVASSFNGVERSYAIQAGREVRIIVKPEDVSDLFSAQISREIAKKIERELNYPGQIKVTVIRESRFVEFAK